MPPMEIEDHVCPRRHSVQTGLVRMNAINKKVTHSNSLYIILEIISPKYYRSDTYVEISANIAGFLCIHDVNRFIFAKKLSNS